MENKIIAYRLKESFLEDKLKEYKKLGEVKFSFQEYIEANFAPTKYLSEFFSKNNLIFNENLSEKMNSQQKENIVLSCMEISFNLKITKQNENI